jgi:acetolactate synthase II small subunit
MQFRLDLQISSAEGALVRVLGMIERRGFTASSVQAQRQADGNWQLQMEVSGQRPGHTLALQLDKIYDCLAVSVSPLVDGCAA